MTVICGEDVESCDSAGKDDTNTNQRERKLSWTMRIKTLDNSLCQLENNVQDDGGIGWLAILCRRLKTNLFRSLDRVVIEAMTQTADDAYHVQITRGLQNYFEKNLALNPETARFLSIDRNRFGNDFRGYAGSGGGFCRMGTD